ncbi:MAG: molecular chaperone HtpG [Ruminococcaceae bacterium]|nr:molecular chaperone HtpG [Oscillospiraceae bacterium]
MAKKKFKAESKRLLDLMVNSIYTHKEIFLREIISNASDAIDKLSYIALTDNNVGLDKDDFKIEIKVDKKHGIITVSDNGIGMSADEMENNLGTIASSGSFRFKQEHTDLDDVDIIGQFGVGFYSAFMVADTITVVSRKYGEEAAHIWQSSGADGYTIDECEREAPGTDVIMKLKADTEDEKYSDYMDLYTIRGLVAKYSDYIRYPIVMDVEKNRKVEGSDDENPEYETYIDTETLNSMIPIWQRPKNEVTDDEYNAFYQDKFYDYTQPVTHLSVSVEGAVTYKALLFIPGKAPYDFYTKDYESGLQLYSSGVMIMENCSDLLSDHFRFVKGVVDSQDLSLNISREMLQHDRQLKVIANNLEKKIKTELKKLMDNEPEKYEQFWNAFGLQIKYGVVSEYGKNKDALADLLMFSSSASDKHTSLEQYVSRMKEEQTSIYYASADSVAKAARLPQTEKLLEKGFEILYLTDEVDEFVIQMLMDYKEHDFKNISTDDLGLDTEEEKLEAEKKSEENKELLEFVKEALGDKVKSVRLSDKLGSHPVCLVADGYLSFEMEKYFAQIQPDNAPKADRVLELNADHAIFGKLKAAMESDPDKAGKYAELLYCQGLLIADLPLEDPTAYTDLVCDLL